MKFLFRFVLFIGCAWLPLSAPQMALAAPTVELMRVPDDGILPQVVTDKDTVHLTYFKGKDSGGDLYYVRSDDGARSWGAPMRVNSQAGSAVAVGAIRGAHLAVGRARGASSWCGTDRKRPSHAMQPRRPRRQKKAPRLYCSHASTMRATRSSRSAI